MNYQTGSFLDKNRDYIVVEHCNLLASSRCRFVAGLFPPLPEESSRSSYKFSSVAFRFKVSNLSGSFFSLIHWKYNCTNEQTFFWNWRLKRNSLVIISMLTRVLLSMVVMNHLFYFNSLGSFGLRFSPEQHRENFRR